MFVAGGFNGRVLGDVMAIRSGSDWCDAHFAGASCTSTSLCGFCGEPEKRGTRQRRLRWPLGPGGPARALLRPVPTSRGPCLVCALPLLVVLRSAALTPLTIVLPP